MAYVKTNWVDNTTPIDKNNLNKIESGIKNNDINIGEENYDNTKTYEVGDIVRYNEKIYKCITAITTAENFDSSKWEQTNIVEIVQSEKSKIYELIEAISTPSEKSKIYELIEALSTPIVGEGENITLNDTAEKRFENFDIEGNSEQEATPSPDYPSEVKSCGDNVNILNLKKYNNQTINGVTLNSNVDGSITLNGTMKEAGAISLIDTRFSISKDSYGFSIGETKLKNFSVYILKTDYTSILLLEMGMTTAQVIKELDAMSIESVEMYIKKGTVFNNYVIKPKLEKKRVTPYSPSGQGNINVIIDNGLETTDANYKSQIYTIPVQQPMRSIGDIRDTFIKKNNKWYEHHPIVRIESYNGETITSEYISNTGELSTGATVDYISDTPVDIECTEEQSTILFDIEQNAKTYKGVTHIYSNDAVSPNCYVEAAKDLTTLIQ